MRIVFLVATAFTSTALLACGSTSNRSGDVPTDAGLRTALTGPFHGYWTGAASGTLLSTPDGSLIDIPIVLDADLARNMRWDMDATDVGEALLEGAGHYNSSVWFVSSVIEVRGSHIYITKNEGSYEDTLCLSLLSVDDRGTMRFDAHSFLADPGMGERNECLAGTVNFDAKLVLHRGVSDLPEFKESGGGSEDPGGDFGAEPPDHDHGGDGTDEESGEDI
jgi:hypothetical protein